MNISQIVNHLLGFSTLNNTVKNKLQGEGDLNAQTSEGVIGFDNLFKKQNITTMVLFHTSWCPHCTDFMGVWDKCRQLSDASSLKIDWIKLDGDQESSKQIYKKYELRGYPSICKIKDGSMKLYDSERTSDNLISFAIE